MFTKIIAIAALAAAFSVHADTVGDPAAPAPAASEASAPSVEASAPESAASAPAPAPVVETFVGRVYMIEQCKGSGGKGQSYSTRTVQAIADISTSSFLGKLGQMAFGSAAAHVVGNAADDKPSERVLCITLTVKEKGTREKFNVPQSIYDREVIRIGKKFDVTYTDGAPSVAAFN